MASAGIAIGSSQPGRSALAPIHSVSMMTALNAPAPPVGATRASGKSALGLLGRPRIVVPENGARMAGSQQINRPLPGDRSWNWTGLTLGSVHFARPIRATGIGIWIGIPASAKRLRALIGPTAASGTCMMIPGPTADLREPSS